VAVVYQSAQAQPLVAYDTVNGTLVPATDLVAGDGVSASSLTRGPGVIGPVGNPSFTTSQWEGFDPITAFIIGDYLGFSLDLTRGTEVVVTGIDSYASRSADGPTMINIGTDLNPLDTEAVTTGGSPLSFDLGPSATLTSTTDLFLTAYQASNPILGTLTLETGRIGPGSQYGFVVNGLVRTSGNSFLGTVDSDFNNPANWELGRQPSGFNSSDTIIIPSLGQTVFAGFGFTSGHRMWVEGDLSVLEQPFFLEKELEVEGVASFRRSANPAHLGHETPLSTSRLFVLGGDFFASGANVFTGTDSFGRPVFETNPMNVRADDISVFGNGTASFSRSNVEMEGTLWVSDGRLNASSTTFANDDGKGSLFVVVGSSGTIAGGNYLLGNEGDLDVEGQMETSGKIVGGSASSRVTVSAGASLKILPFGQLSLVPGGKTFEPWTNIYGELIIENAEAQIGELLIHGENGAPASVTIFSGSDVSAPGALDMGGASAADNAVLTVIDSTVAIGGTTFATGRKFGGDTDSNGTSQVTFDNAVISSEKGSSPSNSSTILSSDADSTTILSMLNGSTWTQDGVMNVGFRGVAEMTVASGSSISSIDGVIARNSTAVGKAAFSDSGSAWHIQNDLHVGGIDGLNGGDALLEVNDGARINVGTQLVVYPQAAHNLTLDGGFVAVGTDPSLMNFVSDQITIGTGGSLAGEGMLMGNVVVTSGTVTPGFSPGTLEIHGDLILHSESTMVIEIDSDTDFDKVLVTGDLQLGGNLSLIFAEGYLPELGSSFDIFTVDGVIAGEFDDVLTNRTDFQLDLSSTGEGLTLTRIVPEPASLLVLAVGSATLLTRRRHNHPARA